MEKFDGFPKNLKKTIRYIKQDASIEELDKIQQLINYAIKKRKKQFNKFK